MKTTFTPDDMRATAATLTKKKKTTSVENVDISTSANGGFSVRVRMKPTPSKSDKSDMSCCGSDSETLVFESRDKLLTYLNDTL